MASQYRDLPERAVPDSDLWDAPDRFSNEDLRALWGLEGSDARDLTDEDFQ